MSGFEKRLQTLERTAGNGPSVRLILLSSLGACDEQKTCIKLPSGELLMREPGEGLDGFMSRAGAHAAAARPGCVTLGVLGGVELMEARQ